jgi:signal peptidase
MKRTLKLLKTIFTLCVVAVAIVMVVFTFFSVTSLNKYDRNIFGWQFFIVTSDSMSKTDFSAGDIIFVKQISDPSTLKEGDIISFRSSKSDNYAGIVTHKIRYLTEDSEGNPVFITYGTTTDTNDIKPVLYEQIIGQYRWKIPKLGYFFSFLKTPLGYIFCILTPFAILLTLQAIQTMRAFRAHKKTERERLDEEWAKLEKERSDYQKQIDDMQQTILLLEQKLTDQNKAD